MGHTGQELTVCREIDTRAVQISGKGVNTTGMTYIVEIETDKTICEIYTSHYSTNPVKLVSFGLDTSHPDIFLERVDDNKYNCGMYDEESLLYAPFEVCIKIKKNIRGWYASLYENDKKTIKLMQNEIDVVFKKLASEACSIHDNASYSMCKSKYMFPRLQVEHGWRERYGVTPKFLIDDYFKYDQQEYQTAYDYFLSLCKLPNFEIGYCKEDGKIILVAMDTKNNREVEDCVFYDYTHEMEEFLKFWGVGKINDHQGGR